MWQIGEFDKIIRENFSCQNLFLTSCLTSWESLEVCFEIGFRLDWFSESALKSHKHCINQIILSIVLGYMLIAKLTLHRFWSCYRITYLQFAALWWDHQIKLRISFSHFFHQFFSPIFVMIFFKLLKAEKKNLCCFYEQNMSFIFQKLKLRNIGVQNWWKQDLWIRSLIWWAHHWFANFLVICNV